MYVRTLSGYDEAWCAKRTSTPDTVYGLGNLNRDRGDVIKAKDMYERAAEGYENVEVVEKPSSRIYESSFRFS